MKDYNLPDNVSYRDPRAPWNATREDEIYNICEDALNATRSLFDLLSELLDIDQRWYFRRFKVSHRHDNPLSMLNELEELLTGELTDLDEKPLW